MTMADDDIDAADNPGVRECLRALEQLHAKFLARKDAFAGIKPDNLVGLALAERLRVQEWLRQNAARSDFDPLALSAMQEALRTTVRPEASGFEVSREEVGHAMGQIDHFVLWRNFFVQYTGNFFEWQLNAAGDGKTAEEIRNTVATLRRSVAPNFADSVMVALRKDKKQDVDAAVRCLAEAMAEE
jgi:hypothetical protein